MILLSIFSFYDETETSTIPDLIPEPGLKKGLRLVLDAHSNLISSGTVFDNFKGFITVVGDPNSFPSTEMNGILLKTGQENYVSILPTDITAEQGTGNSWEGFRKIDPFDRKCYFSDEIITGNPLQLFKNYSQSNCLLECQIEYVRGNMTPPCTPWYFPG